MDLKQLSQPAFTATVKTGYAEAGLTHATNRKEARCVCVHFQNLTMAQYELLLPVHFFNFFFFDIFQIILDLSRNMSK